VYFLPFGKLTNSIIIPQGVRKWAKVDPSPASIPTVSLAPPRIRTPLDVLERAFGSAARPRSEGPGSERRDVSGVWRRGRLRAGHGRWAPGFRDDPEAIGEWDVEHLPPSVQVICDEAVTVGSEQIAASVTVTFAIS
jgi:hypothetical protein